MKLASLERRRVYRIKRILDKVEETYIAGILRENFWEAKDRHCKITDLLESDAFVYGEKNRRILLRHSELGTIRLVYKDKGVFKEILADCVDFSHQGMCFESEVSPVAGEYYNATIYFFNKPDPVYASGHIVWIKDFMPGVFLSGMNFDK